MDDSRSKSHGDKACARLASRQHGVIHLDQARRLGLTKSAVHDRVVTGRWKRVLPEVYGLTGAPATWEQTVMAVALWAGEGSVITHRAAAALFRMDDFRTAVLEVTTPRRLQREGIVVHRATIPDGHMTMIGAIPVTTPARTLVDLAGVAPREVVEGAVDACLRRGLVTPERLKRTAEELKAPGRKGPPVILEILGEGVVESPLERRALRLLCSAGLPEPARQYVIEHNGDSLARVDLAYPEVRLAIEADGYGPHSGPGAFHKDRSRLNRLTMAGWDVLLVTDEDLRKRPEEIVAQVAAVLGEGGKVLRK